MDKKEEVRKMLQLIKSLQIVWRGIQKFGFQICQTI